MFAVKDNDAQLYRRMAPPEQPGLYFIGLVQPIGATIPLAEILARWLAAVISGAIKLPGHAAMDAEIAQHHATLAKTHLGSPRYTLEVDFKDYSAQLLRDMR